MEGTLEIRKVSPKALYELVQILEIGNSWKNLMCIVPSSIDDDSLKYTYEHVKMIEDASSYQKRPSAEIFLDEWGTSGRCQPTLNDLLDLLQKAELYRAAEYVAIQLLKATVPTRPKTGPAASVDVSESNIQSLIDSRLEEIKLRNNTKKDDQNNQSESDRVLLGNVSSEGCIYANSNWHNLDKNFVANYPIKADAEKTKKLFSNEQISQSVMSNENNSDMTSGGPLSVAVGHIAYVELEKCTSSFCDDPFFSDNLKKGHKLGSGAFGSVYYGVLSSANVAVKRLRSDAVSVEKQFKNEIETLSKYQHENLLSLLLYSCDGPFYCLVYAFMSNGSLEDRLACTDVSSILSCEERLNIALGTSRGILYLHTAFEKPLIHRDIKSANILLDEHLLPKLGDFGLVHLGPNGKHGQSIAQTTTVFGTSAYMAREAFWGDISVKLDTFSFGVVLLELLTSLPPYDENREGRDLITHVEDSCENSIMPLLDYRAGTWLFKGTYDISEPMYLLALDCLKVRRQSRPDMSKVVDELEKMSICV